MLLGGEVALISGLMLTILGLVVAFFGRKLAKIVFFLVGGIIGALLALLISPMFISPPYSYIAAVVGFVIVGLIFLLLMRFGAGIVAGLATFMLLRGIVDVLLAIIIALMVLIIVIVLFDKVLSIITAFVGSLIFMAGLQQAGASLPVFLQIIIIAVIAILGSLIQLRT
ncbi:MAG: hypothetical protein LZ166_04530 [Thaumarchaeota archaeon]|jgi:hypothetical protein|nr:hypothetical protein [Candidatus Wolframiiraptor allenii]MCL7394492.1 hypothetical protein [Candidatus Wolframiiraptor allenii]